LHKSGQEICLEISFGESVADGKRIFTGICRDVTERKRTEDERFQLAAIVESSEDAVIGKNLGGIITTWNKGAERIFGFSDAEALGKPLDIIIPESLRKRHRSGFEQTVHSGKSRYGAGDVLAVPALRKDGTRISVEFTILPFRDRSGRTLGIAATLRDVTKRFEEMKALRGAATAKR